MSQNCVTKLGEKIIVIEPQMQRTMPVDAQMQRTAPAEAQMQRSMPTNDELLTARASVTLKDALLADC